MSQNPKNKCSICGIEYPNHDQHKETDVRFIATTFPKTGTNLLIQLFGNPKHIKVSHEMIHLGVNVKSGNLEKSGSDLTYRDVVIDLETFKGIAFGHIPYNQSFFTAVKKVPTIVAFLIRDPRDTIISHFYHVGRQTTASMNYLFHDERRLSERSDPIMDLIRISPERWRLFMPWLEDADMIIRFDDLIENRYEIAKQIIKSVRPHAVAVFKTDNPAKMAQRVQPSLSPTFRKGITNEWRTHFTNKHIAEYKERMGHIHRRLGYELE